VLAYIRAKLVGFDNSILKQPQEELFSHENIRENGLVISEATLLTDSYEASSDLQAGYIMNDNLFADKFRFVYGVRIENFTQNLITGNLKPGDLEVKKSNLNILPSLNLTYLLNKKTNIRFCFSQTLSRPEFRELSPAAFYDYNLSANFTGNPNLEQTTIMNYDLRYEYFFGKGEMISGSMFYKDFKNPIELGVPKGIAATQKVYQYKNARQANLIGAELEFRKSLSWIAKSEHSQWNNIVLFGNLAIIRSSVEVIDSLINGETNSYIRPMQGQSPYVINGGISYTHPKADFNTTVAFNRIGERIFAVGNGEIPETFEAPRNVLDLSFTKNFKKKIELKFTISDIISNPFLYYYNVDKNYAPLLSRQENKYQKGKDFDVINVRQGTNISLSVAYRLK
jgi:Outer membrane receptor proteins, mostly Fe transport